MMQRRLLNFFKTTRAQSCKIEWTFYLLTVDNMTWTESMLAEKGMPTTWVLWISANANYSYTGKYSNGCFSTHRVIRPRKAAWNMIREAESLVADVMEEFSKRLLEVT